MRKYLIPTGLIVAGLLTIPLVAQAIIPQSTIHACVNASGVLQITEIAEECNGQSEALSWNSQGIPGTDGADGADGADGVSGYEVVEQHAQAYVTPGIQFKSFSAVCPTGKVATGGGADSNADAVLTDSFPSLSGDRWNATFEVDGGGGFAFKNFTAYAVCINAETQTNK